MAKPERIRKYTYDWIEINKKHFQTGSNKKKILKDLKVFKTVLHCFCSGVSFVSLFDLF